MEAKKVKAEIVKEDSVKKQGFEGAKKTQGRPRIFRTAIRISGGDALHLVFAGVKIGIALFLDLIDLILGNFAVVGFIWDIISMMVLSVILRNKALLLGYITEFYMPTYSGMGSVNALVPTATILVLIDTGILKYKYRRKKS